jgi:hypothetical protein
MTRSFGAGMDRTITIGAETARYMSRLSPLVGSPRIGSIGTSVAEPAGATVDTSPASSFDYNRPSTGNVQAIGRLGEKYAKQE